MLINGVTNTGLTHWVCKYMNFHFFLLPSTLDQASSCPRPWYGVLSLLSPGEGWVAQHTHVQGTSSICVQFALCLSQWLCPHSFYAPVLELSSMASGHLPHSDVKSLVWETVTKSPPYSTWDRLRPQEISGLCHLGLSLTAGLIIRKHSLLLTFPQAGSTFSPKDQIQLGGPGAQCRRTALPEHLLYVRNVTFTGAFDAHNKPVGWQHPFLFCWHRN